MSVNRKVTVPCPVIGVLTSPARPHRTPPVGNDKNVPTSDNGHNGDGDTAHDPPPGYINLRLERCEQCGDVVVKTMTLGVNPPVGVKSAMIGKPSSAQWKITLLWTGC